jgi:hypothetical protein
MPHFEPPPGTATMPEPCQVKISAYPATVKSKLAAAGGAGRRKVVQNGFAKGCGLDDGLGFGQVLFQLPEVVVRQHEWVPPVLLGHRAIVGWRAKMSRWRGEVQESDSAARAGASDVADHVAWQVTCQVAWEATCQAA